jgi:hypothetical protein
MDHLGERPDDLVLAEALLPLPDRHQADAIPPAQLAWDASAGVHPDEAVDATAPALTDAQYAEKSVAPAQAVPARAATLRLE